MNDSKPSARRGVRCRVVEGAQDQRANPEEQEALVDADLDTLATALYVRTDELLKASPERAPWRPAIGIVPKITDAEVITLAVMAALLRFTSEARSEETTP